MNPNDHQMSHIAPDGRARMVDVGDKDATRREAIAEAIVSISTDLATQIRENQLAKGDALAVARLAGIQAAKRTDQLIPLCHSLPLDHVDVDADLHDDHVRFKATAATTSRTGVEMEALTAAAVAALTLIDMGKAVDKSMVITRVRLLEKRGGRSGEFKAPELP